MTNYDKLLPQTRTTSEQYKHVVKIKAKREVRAGGPVSLAELVREALDLLIEKECGSDCEDSK